MPAEEESVSLEERVEQAELRPPLDGCRAGAGGMSKEAVEHRLDRLRPGQDEERPSHLAGTPMVNVTADGVARAIENGAAAKGAACSVAGGMRELPTEDSGIPGRTVV